MLNFIVGAFAGSILTTILLACLWIGGREDRNVEKYLTGNPDELKKDALKTAINSVYGLTSASFDNKLKDPRNKDNIVAKYGDLFMINLEEEVTNRGYKAVHVSTDSIKVE